MTCQWMAEFCACRAREHYRTRTAAEDCAARGVSDTVLHWRTRTARNHSRARLPEGVGLLWASQRGKAMRHYCLLCFRTVTRPQWWMLRPTYYTPSICRAPLCYTLPALRPCCAVTTPLRWMIRPTCNTCWLLSSPWGKPPPPLRTTPLLNDPPWRTTPFPFEWSPPEDNPPFEWPPPWTTTPHPRLRKPPPPLLDDPSPSPP